MNEHRSLDVPQRLVRDDESLDGGTILRLLDRPLTEDDLRAATERVERPLQQPASDIVRLLVFQLGKELLAMQAQHVLRVRAACQVHRVPHRTNRVMRGICNLDGDLLLCADLATLLDVPREASDGVPQDRPPLMLVLGDHAQQWVAEVDAVRGVMATAASSFLRPPLTVAAALGHYATDLVPLPQDSSGAEFSEVEAGGAARLDQFATLLDVQRVLAGFEAALS